VLYRRFAIEYFKDVLSRIETLLHDEVNAAQLLDRIIQHENARQQGKEFSGAQVGIPDVKEREANPDGSHCFDHRTDNFDRLANAYTAAELLLAEGGEMLGFALLPCKCLYHTDTRKAFLENRHHRSHFLFFELPLAPNPFSVVDDRNHTDRKKEKADESEFPVEMDQDRESADNRKWLLDQVAADTGQSGLRHSSVICDSGDQVSGTFAVKELKRLLEDVGIKLAADIGQYA